jgi:hypothetical protein
LLLLFLPERKVLLEEFDDGFGISESLFINIIDLLESIGQSSFSEFASLLVVVHHFVVEDGEVESQSKSDWVASVEGLGRLAGKLVVLKGSVLDGIKLITGGALGNISVIITDHLVEESFGLVSGSLGHARVLDNVDDFDALIVEFLLDLLLVLSESVVELLVLWVLLDGTDSSNGGSLGANLVLETDGKQVSLLSGEILGFAANNHLEESDHIIESLGLLSNSSHENILFQTHCDFFRLAYTINKIKKFELRAPLNTKKFEK